MLRKKERKHAFDQEKGKVQGKIKENKFLTKKNTFLTKKKRKFKDLTFFRL